MDSSASSDNAIELNLDGLTDHEFVFRAIDQDGAYCRYEALLSYEDEATGLCLLVYADQEPDSHGDVAMYASLADAGQVAEVAAAQQPGQIPRRPPLLDLQDPETDGQWALINALLDELDRKDDEDWDA